MDSEQLDHRGELWQNPQHDGRSPSPTWAKVSQVYKGAFSLHTLTSLSQTGISCRKMEALLTLCILLSFTASGKSPLYVLKFHLKQE